MTKKKLHIILLFWVSVVFTTFAQDLHVPAKSQPFNEESWNAATQKMNYQDDRERSKNEQQQKRINIKDNYKQKEEKEIKPTTINTGSPIGADVFKAICIFLGIGVIGYLAYYFMGGIGARDKKLITEELHSAISEMEENLPTADVETPLEKAIRLGEYKLALRMYFLLIMQKLVQKGFVKWRKDKTNREYISEIRQQPFLPQFMAATLAYEKAWFGYHNITKEEFEQHRNTFEQLKNLI